ncbi:MAG TPA: hypothetical protein VJH03_07730 [Blastocatellia bacterium]|nr:hypothetical protein [Blastocatellia bacterium]
MERDKYCRWCGVAQPSTSGEMDEALVPIQPSAYYTTSPLQPMSLVIDAGSGRAVSGPLVKAVIAAVSGPSSARIRGRFLKSAVMALISVPIWLMIVLLSPLDAYAAAKAVSRVL